MFQASSHETLAGYREVRLCGTGATSRVYRAVEGESGRVVALKRLSRHLVRTSASLARFRRELDALRRVQHPGIAKVHDVVDWDGDPTLVMDYIEGVDLHELVAGGGPLEGDVATRVARDLFDILAASHGAGIVHRDVKPQNIRIRPDGSLVLLDFGSARLDAASKLTTTGTTVGTPEYMPPELFAGSAYDPRVDIYGAGATVFFALTGRAPHTAESLAELATLRNNVDAPRIAEVAPETPVALAQVIDRCLSREPARRYSTAALATWALDHPEVERAFMARRSSQPSCLHCQERIAPESAVCPHCKSKHPFGYDPGLCHVEIVSVSDPARFIEHVVTEFPEHGTPEGVEALAERCAALSFEPQRYVSFIDKKQAEAVVSRLAACGAIAEIGHERTVVVRSVVFAILGAVGFHFLTTGAAEFILQDSTPSLERLTYAGMGLSAVVLCLPAAVAGYMVSSLGSLSRSRHGLLGPARRGAPVSPLVHAVALLIAAVVVAWFHTAMFAATDAMGRYREASLVQGGLAAASAAIAMLACALWCERARFRRGAIDRRLSPEPSRWWKLGSALLPSQRLARARTSPKAVRLVIAAAALVALELGVVHAIYEPSFERHQDQVERLSATRMAWGLERRLSRYREFRGISLETYWWRVHERRGWFESVEAPYSLGAASLVVLASAFLTVLVSRRRRRIRTDAPQIAVELDPVVRLAAETRTPPVTREAPIRHGIVEEVAVLEGGDGFAKDAVSRAADLSHLLEPASAARLEAAIAAMGSREKGAEVRERSFLARSILETDGGQKARFDFLELEGELEAEAAETWWQHRRC